LTFQKPLKKLGKPFKNGETMSLEKEILGFTNWLYTNNWKLIGDGMCLNTETKAIGYINELMVEYNK
jgi:hypothetical protein